MRPTAVILAASITLLFGVCRDPDVSERVAAVTNPNALPGAIFTTLVDGTRVNANIYENKEDVYLDGGPGIHAPIGAAGLPEGDYYFQVTDPSGKDLLSSDHISCRRFHVSADGVIDFVYEGINYERYRGDLVRVLCRHEQGLDVDHDAVTVQLFPYDDTPNRGGVYKVWVTRVEDYTGDPDFVPDHFKDVNGEGWAPGNAHGFVPSQSKTDNYKVRHRGPPYVPPVITVDKFHDRDLDAVRDGGEELVAGWLVIATDPVGTSNHYFTPAAISATEGLWWIAEELRSGTLQTASYLDGALLSAYPAADPVVGVEVAGDSEETHAVLFGNVGLGAITACKRYDRDADGEVGDGPPVAGWRMLLEGTAITGEPVGPLVQVTGADGCTTFAGLLPGSYTVTELLPPGDEWQATGPVSYTAVIESDLVNGQIVGTTADAAFTNICFGRADFGTKGYWHNKNGLAELDESDLAYVNALEPYAAPSSYFDDGDEPFDGFTADGEPVAASLGSAGELIAPPGTPQAEVSRFLVDTNAGADPREQLAQQLLAFVFNTRHRLDGPAAIIELPDGTLASAQSLIDAALDAWASGTADEQHAIASLLDALNNEDDLRFVYGDPCPINYP